jgi:hypothetical protein
MRKTVVALGLALVFLAATGSKAGAQTNGVDFTLQTNAQTTALMNATGMTQAQLQTFLTNKLDQLFQATNAAGFIRNFGDAQSFTSKGLGVDYASEATYFEIGGSASFALGMDRTYQPGSTQGFPIQGVGLNATAMAGVSLGFLKIPVMVFGNWMQVPTQRYGSMSGSLDNWGLHAQLRLWGPSRKGSVLKTLVRWGGIAITTGFDSSHMGLGVSQAVSSNFSIPNSVTNGVNVDVTGPTGTLTGAASGDAVFNIDMTTRSIPVEVTTSVRLLTLLTAYGGLGFDWQLGGGSNLDLKMNANMFANIPGVAGPQSLGTALVHASANVAPSPAKIRGILGAQVNLWLLRLFTQINVANTSPVMASLAVGARLAY